MCVHAVYSVCAVYRALIGGTVLSTLSSVYAVYSVYAGCSVYSVYRVFIDIRLMHVYRVSIGCLYTLYSCIDTLRQSQFRLHVIYHGYWDLSAVDMVDKGGTRCSGVSL